MMAPFGITMQELEAFEADSLNSLFTPNAFEHDTFGCIRLLRRSSVD